MICSFGPLHDDLRHGTTASMFFNANRGARQSPIGPADLYPALKALERRRSAEELKTEQYRRGLAWAAIFEAQAERAKKRGVA